MKHVFTLLFCSLLCLPAISYAQLRISQEAQQALAANNPAPALAELSTMISQEPGNEAALTARANLYNKSGKPREALADARAALKINSRSHSAAYMAAAALAALGDSKEAISTMNTGLIYKRDFIEGVQLLGKLYLKTEQYTLASGTFTDAIRINPQAPENYLFRARALARGTDNPESVADYQAVLSRAPEGSPVYKLAQEELKAPLLAQQRLEARQETARQETARQETEQKAAVADLVTKIKQIEATYLQTMKPLDDEVMAHVLATQEAIAARNRSQFEASKKSALHVFGQQEIAYLKARVDLKALGLDPSQEPLSSMTRLHQSKEKLRETVREMKME